MRHPKIAVCVLLVAQGAGGDTAAPAARVVLQAGL
jgi:cell division protein FtsI/penicillin-binding protein 2